jgi:hypothetical protein
MNWALTAPEQIIAVSTEESTGGREDAIQKLSYLRETVVFAAAHAPRDSIR